MRKSHAKSLLLCFTLLFSSCSTMENSKVVNEKACVAEKVIGKLIIRRANESKFVDNTTDPFGSGPAVQSFLNDFQQCEDKFSRDEKLDLIWAVIWYIDLEGNELNYFLQTLEYETLSDLRKRFDNYVKIEMRLNRNNSAFTKGKRVLGAVENCLSNCPSLH